MDEECRVDVSREAGHFRTAMKASRCTQGCNTMDWSIVAVCSRGDRCYQDTQKHLCDTHVIHLHVFLHHGNDQCWSPPSWRHKCTHPQKRLCLILPTMVPIVRCLHSCSMPMQEVSSGPDVFLRTWNEGPLQLAPLNTQLSTRRTEKKPSTLFIYLRG